MEYSCSNKGGSYKVLQCLLPFWTPLIPPQALTQLKGFVEAHSSHAVKTVDFNVMDIFRELYHKYFNTLEGFVPHDKKGNFYNVGHDVLQNHMMAHFNHGGNIETYIELVKLTIYENYFYSITKEQVEVLNKILDEIYLEIENKLISFMETVKPQVVGFTAYIHTLPAIIYGCSFLKNKYPHIKTLIGGGIFIWQLTPGSPDFEYFLQKTKNYIDKIFIGTGQFLFLKYLNGELPEDKRVYTTKDIEEVLDYSNFVLPDHSDLNIEYYPYLAISGSTSCPNKCSFCSISNYYGEYRKKEPEQAVNEITKLKNRHNRRLFFMLDSLINPIVTDLSKELINKNTSIYFDGYFRVDDDSGNDDNTLLWRKAGFYRARIGIESGSQRILDLMGKDITLDQSRASLKALASAGIKTTTFWLIGHPGETEEDFQMTLNFLEELKDYIYEAEYNPFYYFYTNQAHTDQWFDKAVLLYPEKYRDMVISQTWVLSCEPSREEVFKRINRFEEHRIKQGIPNPYTMEEIHQADKRWKRLHRNAVPSLVEVEQGLNLDERKHVKKMNIASQLKFDDIVFDF